jgi:HD superfamily phosphodiesterase
MRFVEDKAYAYELLNTAGTSNPGPWVEHSKNVAGAAERIAHELRRAGAEIQPDIAYTSGLLHDIGRYIGFHTVGNSFS